MHLPRHARRTAALAAALVAIGAPALSSCGFDAATGHINLIAAGVNDRSGQVDILGAVIVASGPGTGVFEATLSNNVTIESASASAVASPSPTPNAGSDGPSTDGQADLQTLPAGADQLVSLTGGSQGGLQATAPIKPFVIQPAAAVNLFRDNLGIPVKGSWDYPGPFISVKLTFASGQTNTLQVPVVKPCNEYAGIVDTPTPAPGASDSGVGGTDADTDAFSCDPETQPTQTGSAAAGDE